MHIRGIYKKWNQRVWQNIQNSGSTCSGKGNKRGENTVFRTGRCCVPIGTDSERVIVMGSSWPWKRWKFLTEEREFRCRAIMVDKDHPERFRQSRVIISVAVWIRRMGDRALEALPPLIRARNIRPMVAHGCPALFDFSGHGPSLTTGDQNPTGRRPWNNYANPWSKRPRKRHSRPMIGWVPSASSRAAEARLSTERAGHGISPFSTHLLGNSGKMRRIHKSLGCRLSAYRS